MFYHYKRNEEKITNLQSEWYEKGSLSKENSINITRLPIADAVF